MTTYRTVRGSARRDTSALLNCASWPQPFLWVFATGETSWFMAVKPYTRLVQESGFWRDRLPRP